MTDNHFRLVTLGRLALLDGAGEPVKPLSRHPRKLAVLAVVALASKPVSRETLAEMFWGDREDHRARHSLSDALSEIRYVLGVDSLTVRGETVALAPTAPLAVDVLAFRAAHGVGDWARAVGSYTGAFLDGVFIQGAQSFEEWASAERQRLERAFLEACEGHVAALTAQGLTDVAVDTAERWFSAAPLDSRPALALLAALRAPGTPAAEGAALAAFDRMTARLERDYETRPDPAVVEAAAEIRARLAALPNGRGNFPLETGARSGKTRPVRRRALWLVTAAVVLAAGAFGLARRTGRQVSATRPVVAVLGVRDLRGDTGATWIADGLTQMIAADLARSSSLEIVAPERVRAAVDAMGPRGGQAGAAFVPVDPLPVARALGANWIVTGGLTRGDTSYTLDVNLYDVAAGRSLSLYTVVGQHLPTIADQAAARILAVANSNEPGPRLAEIETASLEAYQHFVRAVELRDEGRAADQRAELDQAIALDSGFVTALAERMRLAQQNGEVVVLGRLAHAFQRAASRATPWDRLELDTYASFHRAERARSEALARELTARYPHDPRAYGILANILTSHGAWATSDSVLRVALSLDSLGVSPGRGPCAPCTAYNGLVENALMEGRLADAELAARQWVAIQPDAPGAWSALTSALEAQGRFDAALVVGRRARALAPGESDFENRIVRILLKARRYEDADTAIARMRRTSDVHRRVEAMDLAALLQRERGQLRASAATIERAVRESPRDAAVLGLEAASSLAALGDYAAVTRLVEPLAHDDADAPLLAGSVTPVSGLVGGVARQFCWVHALEAEGLFGMQDTTLLVPLADSIAEQATRSYYGRDWRLADHVRGLIAEIAGRPAEAERLFQSARWGIGGWTATLLHLARVQLTQDRPLDAIRTLRDAYTQPLDGMGRYVPRSELDFWSWQAFRRAGMADSAATYQGYVARAWSAADPEVRRRLDAVAEQGNVIPDRAR